MIEEPTPQYCRHTHTPQPHEPVERMSTTDNIYQTTIRKETLSLRAGQYYTLLEQKAIILIFISIIDINVNLSKNEIDKKINLS